MTELFLFGQQAPVPPACRRPTAPLGSWQLLGPDEAVLDLPLLRPRSGALQLLPSLSIAADHDHAFRFAARLGEGATWTFASPVGALPPTSPDDREPLGTRAGDPNLRCEIDVFRAKQPIREVRVRVWLRARERATVLEAPTLLAVSLSDDLMETHASPTDVVDRIALSVPALSQMEAPEDLRMRICSPTCVAMVLAYWGSGVDLVDLSEEMRDARQDLYGVWPAAILAAARRGIHGYLLRFPSWGDAEWCLRRRLPVIASIRYRAGELEGAAVEATSGHLVVLTGIDGASVLVNDPAAPSRREVPRAYALKDLQRVWLERTGVGYVLFPPAFAASADCQEPATRSDSPRSSAGLPAQSDPGGGIGGGSFAAPHSKARLACGRGSQGGPLRRFIGG